MWPELLSLNLRVGAEILAEECQSGSFSLDRDLNPESLEHRGMKRSTTTDMKCHTKYER